MKNLKMKLIFPIVAIGLSSVKAFAQNPGAMVPEKVETSFSSQYPQDQVKKWKMENGVYVASFKANNKKYKASYASDGTWQQTERNIRHTSSLPAAVMLYLKKGKYASWHIDGLKKVQTTSESVYVVQVDNNSGNQMAYENIGSIENRMLYFNSSGELLKINTL